MFELPMELAMNEVTRLCELEAECRLRALSEPEKIVVLARAGRQVPDPGEPEDRVSF